MNNLLAVPVLLCLLGAATTFLAGRHPVVQRAISITAVAAVSVVAGLLVWLTDTQTLVLWVGDWPVPLGIVLVADRLAALMLLVAALVSLAVLVYSTGQDEDEIRRVERGYGPRNRKPADYLEDFAGYLKENLNKIPALLVVTQRPRDLTRGQLKELEQILAQEGYTHTSLRTAWRDTTNVEIAASIIGFIRQRALGCPLTPYAERVDRALQKILAKRAWTPPQRNWLNRIAKQMKQETVVDREALDRGQFKSDGGFNRLNKIFEGQMEAILGDLQEAAWEDEVA